MKKNSILFTVIISLVGFAFISCNFLTTSKPDSGITAPAIDVDSSGTALVITPTILSSTEYMNIFRYEVTGTGTDATVVENSLRCIGQILKSAEYTKTGTIIFFDKYTDNAKFYQYYVRYRTTNGYKVSKTTGTYAGRQTNADYKEVAVKLAGGVEKVKITYDADSAILSLNAAEVTIPNTDKDDTENPGQKIKFTFEVAISNSAQTRLFKLTEVTGVYQIDLRKVLPDQFLDTNLTIKALVGVETYEHTQGESENLATDYYNYYYSMPLKEITLHNIKDEEISYFVVKNENELVDLLEYPDGKISE